MLVQTCVLIFMIGLCSTFSVKEKLCDKQCHELNDYCGAQSNVSVCDYSKSLQVKLDCVASCMKSKDHNVANIILNTKADPKSLLEHKAVKNLLKNFNKKYPIRFTTIDLGNGYLDLDNTSRISLKHKEKRDLNGDMFGETNGTVISKFHFDKNGLEGKLLSKMKYNASLTSSGTM
ncbi:hypothetical protein O3M35_009478 [Rhynocoris fuscipes]|uniref:Uncharacterized protein n=1 Tax=Rhynocoris fuscipes TaxID=488301 RepID=A0AAW1D318_9HEMI